MQIQEIMTRSVEVIDPNTTVREAAKKMRDENIGAIPVGENDRLIGMVTDRDIVMRGVAAERSPSQTAVRDVMSEGIWYCFEDQDVKEAADIMAEHQIRRLPIVNRDKRLVGIVALADVGRSKPEAAQSAIKGISEPTDKERR